MRNTFSKIFTTVVMAVIFVVNMPCINAEAATGDSKSQTYNSRYIAVSPGTNSYTDVCNLYATSAGYTATCSSLSISSTKGSVKITCSTEKITMNKTIEFTQANKSDDFSLKGDLVNFVSFPCACSGNGDVFASGTIKTK